VCASLNLHDDATTAVVHTDATNFSSEAQAEMHWSIPVAGYAQDGRGRARRDFPRCRGNGPIWSGFFELDQRRLLLVSAQQLFPTHQRSKLRTFVAARKLNLFH
jgi:hypothetical protein